MPKTWFARILRLQILRNKEERYSDYPENHDLLHAFVPIGFAIETIIRMIVARKNAPSSTLPK